LRGIFASHVMTSNYSFLKNADTSFIAKMSIYEFDAIIQFMGNIPDFASFPVGFLFAVALILFTVGLSSLVMIPIFATSISLLFYFDYKLM